MIQYLPPPCFNLIKEYAGINPSKFFARKIAKMVKKAKPKIKNFINEINFGLRLTVEENIYHIRHNWEIFGNTKEHTLKFYMKPSHLPYGSTIGHYVLLDVDFKNWICDLPKKTKKELIIICKQNKIKKYSTLKKHEIINLIIKA